jgi:hypothetical protein
LVTGSSNADNGTPTTGTDDEQKMYLHYAICTYYDFVQKALPGEQPKTWLH